MLMLISGFWKMVNSENKNTAVLTAWFLMEKTQGNKNFTQN